MSQDLYLDPNFKVEGNDFVFEAHDDNNVDYVVKVTLDDFCAFIDVSSDDFDMTKKPSENEAKAVHEACQTIVDRFQTGTTSYDVEIKRKNNPITRIQAIEKLKAAPSDERYTIQVNDAFDGTGTAKDVLKWFSIGVLRAVWDDDLVLLGKAQILA